ncbi:SDR family oxidoreductase [Planococcus lenghuensis]|uniref:Oxidoreductase n=1 Tax=Planococcus lenghuensis TaxID=2213202 RepID=A0A1Q2KXV6_9BACL|nr:SDR family oxidoreductase [Planococcus lenghuensis]AQQ52983.1 oxidoreductase [Planococcus lenghuensis]
MKIPLRAVEDQVIVITGATSGIGLATARMAAEKGAKIIAVSRNEDALRQLIDELRNHGHTAEWIKADVGQEGAAERIAETAIAAFGGFDTWVNNAAITIFGKAMDVPATDMHRLIDTNFWGVVHGSRTAVNYFKRTGKPGALINVGSIYGSRGANLQSIYSAAKFAVHGWTESLRTELENDRVPVSVSLIHPGRIDTPFNEHAVNYLPKHPAHRGYLYHPEAVADAILHCAAHPRRDMYIGTQAKLLTAASMLAPRLMDKVLAVAMYPTHHDSRPSDPGEDNSLYQPGYGMHEQGTNKGPVKHRSLYVQATKQPWLPVLAVAGLAAAFWKTSRDKRTKPDLRN